jgi:transcriptional regulator with XRE-family HTH domain
MTVGGQDAKLFGRNLCLLRCRRGLSQEALARGAGLCRDTVWKTEMGIRSPTLGTLLALADALNVDPGELLEGLR